MIYRKIALWIDSRIGLTHTILRSVPDYILHPIHWIGALAVVSFLIQGLTGALMLLYYVPHPDNAYFSTTYIMEKVPFGLLIETLHLYNAYGMILFAFAHLTRNYFLNVQKRPRELMWMAGILLGFVVLGFGITGYLLPWTVVSKSATDVAIGMLNLIPGRLGSVVNFLITGGGGDEVMLMRFLIIHILILPALLLSILAIKLYMYEIHGPVFPWYILILSKRRAERIVIRRLKWFPNVFLYLLMIAGTYIAILIAISSVIPITLPPKFSPEAASSYVTEPDWYLLWLYQILKFSVFEGPEVEYALILVIGFLFALLLLPFIDRVNVRDLTSRPLYTMVGTMILAEFITLTIWGSLTPGQVIATWQAIAVMGSVASIVFIIFLKIYGVKEMIKATTNSSSKIISFVRYLRKKLKITCA
jgi:quinol-cytochrome oxidoreductase complex cytochrome b subunit